MYPTAVAGLADLYYSYADQGVPKNLPEALRLLEIAATLGEASAQHRLGVMYYEGEGIGQDDLKAYTWLKLSAANNDPEGIEDFATIREQITPEMMKQVDLNIGRLSKTIESNVADMKARYAGHMGAEGVTVVYPAQ
jgi:TPR repeat protein